MGSARFKSNYAVGQETHQKDWGADAVSLRSHDEKVEPFKGTRAMKITLSKISFQAKLLFVDR